MFKIVRMKALKPAGPYNSIFRTCAIDVDKSPTVGQSALGTHRFNTSPWNTELRLQKPDYSHGVVGFPSKEHELTNTRSDRVTVRSRSLTMHVGDEDLGHLCSFGFMPNRRLEFELSVRAFRAIDHWMSKGNKRDAMLVSPLIQIACTKPGSVGGGYVVYVR